MLAVSCQDSQAVRAPLRWAGSKRASLHTLLTHAPKTVSHYIEPFAGSGCLAFAIRPNFLVLGDINPQLIDFYSYLKSDPSGLHALYASYERTPESYYQLRETYNQATSSLERAALFLYLNRHCFNGIYRVNGAGKFNVPWGGDKAGRALSLLDLSTAASALQSAHLLCEDFESVVLSSLRPNSFVYLDPPYASDEARVFREYHERSFSSADWSRLVSLLKTIDDAGAKFLLSYAAPTLVSQELAKWSVGHLDVMRNVGGFRSSRRRYREFMASNIDLTI
jgi:DNA adenine methylase